MVLHPIVRPLGIIISCIGLIQGLAWFVFCVLGILIKHGVIVPADATTYSTTLSKNICLLYLGEHVDLDPRYIHNGNFHIFLYVYLVLSIAWYFVSCYMFWLLRMDKWKPIKICFAAWIGVVLITSILDFCLTVLIGLDYKDYVAAADILNNPSLSMTILATGIVMSLVARGYLLWCLNILAIICIGIFIGMLEKEEDQPENYNNTDPISAYGAGIPVNSYSPSYVEVSNNANPMPQLYHVNGAFVEDEVPWEGGVPSSYSHRGQEYNAFDEFPSSERTSPREEQPHLAKIGRGNNKRSPVLNKVPPPVVPPIDPDMPKIPTPDYTPPNSPSLKTKSVLKANQQYAAF